MREQKQAPVLPAVYCHQRCLTGRVIIKTGSPMLEVLTEQMPKVKRNTAKVLKKMGVTKGTRHAIFSRCVLIFLKIYGNIVHSKKKKLKGF